MPDSYNELVDRIYEAAVVPELWPQVLEDLSSLAGGVGSALFSYRADRMRWLGTPMMVDLLAAFVALGRLDLNIRSPRALALCHPGFVTDQDLASAEELETHPFYTEFLRPRGVGWCTGAVFKVPGGDDLLVTIERRYDAGPFSRETVRRLNPLRPHLGRAALLSARLELERAKAATQALELIGLPAAVLSDSHRLLVANDRMQEIIPEVVQDSRQRVALASKNADMLLGATLEASSRGGHLVQVRSIPIAARGGRSAMIVHLVPVRGAAHDIFSGCSFVMVVTPVMQPSVPSAGVIQGLFDLTAAEARVARGLAEGNTLEAVAAGLGVSVGTVRAQLKSVFAKTGLSRQADLVGLLCGAVLPGT